MPVQPLKFSFAKMSGAGNDFVVIDNRDRRIPNHSNFASAVCDRRYGIGGDGLLLLEPSGRAAFSMKYYNADGSHGGMCGNGGRCIGKFAFLERVVSSRHFTFEALGHPYEVNLLDNLVRLKMKNPSVPVLHFPLPLDSSHVKCHFVDTGSPHCVIFVDDNPQFFSEALEKLEIRNLGKAIRFHERFAPEGTNVNFVSVIDTHRIAMRTYERGVENETLACGTGSIASSLIAHLVKNVQSPVNVSVRSGEELVVEFAKNKSGFVEEVFLTGSAVISYRGTLLYDPALNKLVEPA